VKLAILNGTLIDGDGNTIIPHSQICINHGLIEYAGTQTGTLKGYHTIDASGKLVIPGIVNTHTHGVVYGAPLFSSGSSSLTEEQVYNNIRRHLSEGTTTVVSVDGFANLEDVVRTARQSPLNVFTTVTYSPKSYSSAQLIDGKGINRKNAIDLETIDTPYVVGIGECGSGATLGGGVQDYKFIPEAIRQKFGVQLSEIQSRQLKESVLGRNICPENYNPQECTMLIKEFGLPTTAEEIRRVIQSSVLPPFYDSVDSLRELTTQAQKYHIPVMIHNSAASMCVIEELVQDFAKNKNVLVAGHSNHPSFTLKEALGLARRLKEQGSIIDISTFDTLQTGNETEINYFVEFLRSGMVDTITTDYGGGNHSSILSMLDLMVKERVIDLPSAIRLVTYNPSNIFSKLHGRGLIKAGNSADIVITEMDNLSEVNMVFVNGIQQFSH